MDDGWVLILLRSLAIANGCNVVDRKLSERNFLEIVTATEGAAMAGLVASGICSGGSL